MSILMLSYRLFPGHPRSIFCLGFMIEICLVLSHPSSLMFHDLIILMIYDAEHSQCFHPKWIAGWISPWSTSEGIWEFSHLDNAVFLSQYMWETEYSWHAVMCAHRS